MRGANVRNRLRQGCVMLLRDGNPAPAVDRGWDGDRLACRHILAGAARGPGVLLAQEAGCMKIATGGALADTADIRRHLEVIRHELRPPLGILDLAEGHADVAGDAQLADALATLGHRLVETLDAYERAVEALDALEAIGRERATPTG